MQLQRGLILAIVIAAVLSSCCTTRVCKIERAEKKIYNLTQKYPELLNYNDTIIIADTIIKEASALDTTFIPNNTDTIIVENEKIIIRYIKNDSIVFLEGICKADTVFINKEIPVEKIIVRELTFKEKLKDWAYFLFAIAALLLVLRIFFKDIFKIFR